MSLAWSFGDEERREPRLELDRQDIICLCNLIAADVHCLEDLTAEPPLTRREVAVIGAMVTFLDATEPADECPPPPSSS